MAGQAQFLHHNFKEAGEINVCLYKQKIFITKLFVGKWHAMQIIVSILNCIFWYIYKYKMVYVRYINIYNSIYI